MIDRIEVIAELMAYQGRLKAAGKVIQAVVVGRCIAVIRRMGVEPSQE